MMGLCVLLHGYKSRCPDEFFVGVGPLVQAADQPVTTDSRMTEAVERSRGPFEDIKARGIVWQISP